MKSLVPQHIRRTVLVRALFLGVLAVTATLVYLWQHMAVVDLGYRLERSRTELARLQHQRSELTLEAASLASLSRIEKIARTELGMDSPRPEQLVRVVRADTPDAMDGAPRSTPRSPAPQGAILLARATTR
ncbi:MAG: cell division protein FtsL [Nitrospirota bacterium]|nr:cell division protein FtsL [Nitrospirota bacterium]